MSFDWQTVDGTATVADNDYDAASGSVPIAAGETYASFSVAFHDDTKVEPDERFRVTVTPSIAATFDAASSDPYGHILDDDGPVSLGLVSDPLWEGDADTQDLWFYPTLSHPVDDDVTLDWETMDDTATEADDDYVGGSGSVTILAGSTSTEFSVTVNGDVAVEPDELFAIALSNLPSWVNEDPNGADHFGHIRDDDADPPDNDMFASAMTVSVPPFTVSQPTVNTTLESDEPTRCGPGLAGMIYLDRTLWFRYAATWAARLTVSTTGSDYDTAILAYSGPPGASLASLTRVGCNDDVDGGVHSRLAFDVAAGGDYWIQVGGHGGVLRAARAQRVGRPSPDTQHHARRATGRRCASTERPIKRLSTGPRERLWPGPPLRMERAGADRVECLPPRRSAHRRHVSADQARCHPAQLRLRLVRVRGRLQSD